MTTVVITKSSPVLVCPSSTLTTPTGDMKLSSFDKSLANLPFTVFLMYDHHPAVHHPIDTIKNALSLALDIYYPIAGRLADGDDGELHIACTGEGVRFVAASANCTLENAMFFEPSFATSLLKDLAICYPIDGFRGGDPLLVMQVTEFSYGGFVVGVTWNHVIADGVGMGQFLQAVGEFGRGLSSPSVFPVRYDESLPVFPPLLLAKKQWAMSRVLLLDIPNYGIVIPTSLISRIRAELGASDDAATGEPSCTVFEAVTAVLWQCRARAVASDPDGPALLLFTSNVRKRLGAKHGYYGNCFVTQVAMASSGAVANGDIKDVVRLIKDAKEAIPDLFDDGDGAVDTEELSSWFGYHNMFLVSSWRNLGFDAADFSGGKPAGVMSYSEWSFMAPCVVCPPPSKGDNAAAVSSLYLKEEHAKAFLAELAKLIS